MRKCYTRSDRVALMAAVKRGDSVPEAAGRLGVGISTAYQWTREARVAEDEPVGPTPTTFVELMSSVEIPNAALTVHVGVAEIEVRPGFDPALLRAVVGALAVSE